MFTRFAIIAACSLLSGFVIAADDAYSILDTDHSGTISVTEAAVSPSLTAQWQNLDVNANGELSVEEFAQFELSEIPAQEPSATQAPAPEAPADK